MSNTVRSVELWSGVIISQPWAAMLAEIALRFGSAMRQQALSELSILFP